MNKVTTSDRLRQLLYERNMKQVDILNKVKPVCEKYKEKMNKSDISQYVAGKVVPGQRKLTILAEALNVDVTWLMGYDIDYDDKEIQKGEEYGELIRKYSQLTPEGKIAVLHLIDSLLSLKQGL